MRHLGQMSTPREQNKVLGHPSCILSPTISEPQSFSGEAIVSFQRSSAAILGLAGNAAAEESPGGNMKAVLVRGREVTSDLTGDNSFSQAFGSGGILFPNKLLA